MSDTSIKWFNVRDIGIKGKGWQKTEKDYDRLPIYAKDMVSADIWMLGHYSTGLYTFFCTDTPTIYARWEVGIKRSDSPHMPDTSTSGLDLYAQDELGEWRWVASGIPKDIPTCTVRLIYGLLPSRRTYLLYLPLYNNLEKIEIGIELDFSLEAASYDSGCPVVFYGTSITQGIACSRPGMCYTAICQRRLKTPTVNLGFSGRGKMEQVLAILLAEIDAKAYIIDCLPNMPPELVKERAEVFVKTLSTARPDIPVIIVEDRTYTNAWIVPALLQRNLKSREYLRNSFIRLKDQGFENVHYLKGESLLGSDNEATVDGTHPSYLGFMRIADYMIGAINSALRPLKD